MPKRTIGSGFERLEIRDMMDADPVTVELSPIVKGTIESTYTQWSSVRDTGSGQGVFHNAADQAGLQRHLWTGNYYGWEGMAEFSTDLPEGAVIDDATLRLTVTQKLDTMNRKPSLVAHLSTQEAVGSITPGEYNNATGAALGAIAYDAVTPGQESEIAIDPATIPANGNVSISLRTSDQIAGQEPESSHNSQSVFHYSNIRLDVRYHVPDAPMNTDAVDAVMADIGDDAEDDINADPSLLEAVMDSLDEESWNQLSSSLESAFELERMDAEFRENYRRNNIDVAAVSLTAIGPMLTAAQQTFATASAQYTQTVNTFNTAEAAWTPVRQKYLAAEAQEKELYRLHLAATTKAERNRTANTLNDYRNYVFYPLRTQETTLATAMNAARTAMNNAGTAHTQAQAKLTAVTEALNNIRAFAARSQANNAELPSLPVVGEPAAPSITAETAEGKNYAGAAKMSSWIESRTYGNVMIVRFASAGDSTTFDIPMFGATHTAYHANGTADMTIEIRLNMEAVSSRWSATPFSVTMKDGESSEKIEENRFSVDLSAANILSRLTPIDRFWEREAEAATPAISPRIVPVLAERNHLMVSIDAAGASTQIGIEGIHNPLSQISVNHAGGALGITRTLTFTQDIPSGTYNVILSTQEHGLTLASIPVTWNSVTKIVSYDERAFASLAGTVADEPLSDSIGSEFVALGTSLRAEAAESTNRTDPYFSNALVRQQTLQGLTYPTLTNIWTTAEAKMMAAFPDIFPTNESAWVAARVAASNGTLTAGIVEDRLHSTQSDMRHRLRDGLADMEQVGLNIIDLSMQAAARIYSGSSQQTEWSAFQSAYASLLTTPAYRAEVGFLSSCGIFMPSATAFWNESWTQFHAQQDFLVHMHEEERHLVDEILPNLSRNKAITEAKNHAGEQAAADLAAGRQPKAEEQYVDDYFAQIARDSRGNGDERRREVTERQIRRILSSSDGRTQAFAERIGLRDMDIAQAIVAAMDPAVLESVAQRYETEKDDVLTEAMEDVQNGIRDLIVEQELNGIAPEDFMNRYLTPVGKVRYLHLLETEDELSHYGYDVASTPEFTGNFDEMYQGMFERSAVELEPVYFKIKIDFNKLPIIKPSPIPLIDIINSVDVTIGHEDPGAALLRRAEAEINRMVLEETAEAIQDIGISAKRSLVAMRRAAVWTAVTSYNAVDEGAEYMEDQIRALGKLTAMRIKDFTPFLRADNAESYAEKHQILLQSGIMEHRPGNGEKAGKLIILVNGHMQSLGSNADKTGIEYVEDNVPLDYEILHFRVGLAWEPLYRNPDLIYKITEEVLFERLNRQGIFSNSPKVTSMVAAGYSWAGGTAARYSHSINASEFGDVPFSVGLIDAVQIGYGGMAQAVSITPPADYVFNRYQTNNNFTMADLLSNYGSARTGQILTIPSLIAKFYSVATEGQPAHGQFLLGAENENIANATHLTIDDSTEPFGEKALNELTDFLLLHL